MRNLLAKKYMVSLLTILALGCFLTGTSSKAFACSYCEDLSLHMKVIDNGYVLEGDQGEYLKANQEYFGMSDSEIADALHGTVYGSAKEMQLRYPRYQIVEIDGKPWQQSPYADYIESILYQQNSKWFDTPYEEVFKDPSLNGKGKQVEQMVESGKTVSEIKAALGNTTPAPIQQPKPPVPTVPGTPGPVNKDFQLVLAIGKNQASEITDGVSRPTILDVAPMLLNGRTMVPVRGIMEKFGANVKWDPQTNKVTVIRGQDTVILTINSTKAMVNDQEVVLSTPATVIRGRTLIPLRFVSEGLGLTVDWNEQTQSILIK